MTPTLSIVATNPSSKPSDTVGQRVRALQAEARLLARGHAGLLHDALVDLHAMAAEIAAGGEAYSPGVQAIARDIIQSSERQGLTLAAINGRTS